MLAKELIIRGNKSDKIIEYFEGIASKECEEAISYIALNQKVDKPPNNFNYKIESKSWFVELTHEQEIYIGKMIFPEVIVKISATDSSLEDIIYNFRIQFLSAGG